MSIQKVLIRFMLIILLITNISWSQIEGQKHSINNGGSLVSGGDFVLKSSIGQVDASAIQNGDEFELNGGFWQQLADPINLDIIFKNGFEL